MRNRILFFGIPVDSLTMTETVNIIKNSIKEKRITHHVALNAAKVVNLQKDIALKESIMYCDIINADGQSIVWASKFLGNPLPERVAGIDLMINLVEMASKEKHTIFLLGAEREILKNLVTIYEKKYGSNLIAGFKDGYFKYEEEEEIADMIANSRADMLFVAITSPRKEIFLNKYKDIIKIPFIMGVGGSFDVISGKTRRAPLWIQKIGFEWLYRVIQEPKRMWKRYLIGNSAFLYLVFKEKIKQLLN